MLLRRTRVLVEQPESGSASAKACHPCQYDVPLAPQGGNVSCSQGGVTWPYSSFRYGVRGLEKIFRARNFLECRDIIWPTISEGMVSWTC